MSRIIPLSELREQIDAIDAQLLQLINQRALCAIEVAKTKIASGEDGVFYRPDREAMVLRRIKDLNQGPLSDHTTVRFFRELMSACLALEKPMDVAFLGPEGTFTQQAAFKHFGHGVNTLPVTTIAEIFSAVELYHCQFGVVPVENSTEGVINHTLDRFLSSSLQICGEVEIRVHQNLLSKSAGFEGITEIYSHQQSLAQCRQWLDKKLPNVRLHAVSSNAEAARLASLNANSAAIAGVIAAEVYGLNIIAKNIEDEPNNTTRFIIIGQQASAPTGSDKTSFVVSMGNQAGSLYKTLAPFAKLGIDMLNIESRPSRRGLWDYIFFIDIDGHCESPEIAQAFALIKEEAKLFKLLGSYPKAIL
jgi:chorismate mutase/prephenate dehydratase